MRFLQYLLLVFLLSCNLTPEKKSTDGLSNTGQGLKSKLHYLIHHELGYQLHLVSGDEIQILVDGVDWQADTDASVLVDGKDIYIVATVSRIDSSKILVWKNGALIETINSARWNVAYGLILDNDKNIYVYGDAIEDGKPETIARYWKNGVAFSITSGFDAASIRQMKIYNGKKYFIGTQNGLVKLWINGAGNTISEPTNLFTDAVGLEFFQDDIYIFANHDSKGKVWKNGILHTTLDQSMLWTKSLSHGQKLWATSDEGQLWENGLFIDVFDVYPVRLRLIDEIIAVLGFIVVDNKNYAAYYKDGETHKVSLVEGSILLDIAATYE